MPGWEIVVGCVGKPSAGKSTLFNAVTDGNAKVRIVLCIVLLIGRQLPFHNDRTEYRYYILFNRVSMC